MPLLSKVPVACYTLLKLWIAVSIGFHIFSLTVITIINYVEYHNIKEKWQISF